MIKIAIAIIHSIYSDFRYKKNLVTKKDINKSLFNKLIKELNKN